MTPPLDKLTPASPHVMPGTDPDTLRDATARLRAFSGSTKYVLLGQPRGVMAYLASIHVRRYELTEGYRRAYALLSQVERERVAAVVAEFMDESVPLVRPDDLSVTQGSAIMGRRVRGSDLVVRYIPAGNDVFMVNIARTPAS